MKRLARAAALTLAIITFFSAAYGNTSLKINTFPYVIGAVSFPPSQARASRNQVVRHSFEFQIPEGSRALSELSIGVPNSLSVGNKISVSAQVDRKIATNIFINGKGIVIVFPKPVAPGTRLRVNVTAHRNRTVLLRMRPAFQVRKRSHTALLINPAHSRHPKCSYLSPTAFNDAITLDQIIRNS